MRQVLGIVLFVIPLVVPVCLFVLCFFSFLGEPNLAKFRPEIYEFRPIYKGFFIKKNMAQIGQIPKKKKFRQISS
jgi:uncharacterized protein YybS (DUF2232 family)